MAVESSEHTAVASDSWYRRMAGFRPVVVALIIAASFVYCVKMPTPFFDFRAFYCAGAVVLAGADPYREHPLHEVEQDVYEPPALKMRLFVTVPAPFPGYVLALFAVLARLPFAVALAGWTIAATAALSGAIACVARTTRTPLLAAVIVLAYPAAIVALPLGQVTPFILAGVAGSAALLERGRPRIAALAALVTLIDPHVGLALVAALFIGVPATRGVLGGGIVALAVAGLLVSSPAREWEYLHAVIPAHALANIADGTQFSVTNFAYYARVPDAIAVQLGTVWYIGALVLGVAVALRLRIRLGIATVAYIPPAFAVFGGTHTHLQQLAIALPAFLLVTSAATGSRRDLLCVLTFIAAVPWLCIAPYPWLALPVPVLALVFAREMAAPRLGLNLAFASAVMLGVTELCSLRYAVPRALSVIHVHGNPLAEVSWQTFMTTKNVPIELWCSIARIPTAVAFIAFFILLVRITREHRPARAPAPA